MQTPKLSTLLALVFGAVLLGTAVDATLTVGDTFKGTLTIGDEDVVRFPGVAGQRFTANIKADKGSGLLPEIRVIDLSTMMDVVPPTSTGKKKVGVKKVELPSTGLYEIRITSVESTIGAYTIKTKEKLGKAVLKPSTKTAIGPEETQDTTFGAKENYTLNGTIAAPKKSDAMPFNPTISGPDMEEGTPVELTGFISKNAKGKFTIKDLVLPDLGTYVLTVENSGLSGVINTNLKLKKPKVQKQTITEDEG